jgi:hypothetical protein
VEEIPVQKTAISSLWTESHDHLYLKWKTVENLSANSLTGRGQGKKEWESRHPMSTLDVPANENSCTPGQE